MTGYGASSLTAFGLLVGLYGYLGRQEFLQFFGLTLAMLLVIGLMLGMLAAGVELVEAMRRNLAPRPSPCTIPAWFLTD